MKRIKNFQSNVEQTSLFELNHNEKAKLTMKFSGENSSGKSYQALWTFW